MHPLHLLCLRLSLVADDASISCGVGLQSWVVEYLTLYSESHLNRATIPFTQKNIVLTAFSRERLHGIWDAPTFFKNDVPNICAKYSAKCKLKSKWDRSCLNKVFCVMLSLKMVSWKWKNNQASIFLLCYPAPAHKNSYSKEYIDAWWGEGWSLWWKGLARKIFWDCCAT